ncbi:MAG: DUF2309 domain-containing protein [Gammaproteobacteria bacterium]|nr:DUF2309 domain-containing protein [Gammaproteobacteria bacterium]
MTIPTKNSHSIQERLQEAISHFEHILPGQAPLKDFVHHNTLHAFQHLSFPEALEESRKLTGIYGYLPEDRFREFHRQGRVTDQDLVYVLDRDPDLQVGEVVFTVGNRTMHRREVYLAGLVHPFKPVTDCQLTWQIEEHGVLQRFQADVPEGARNKILGSDDQDSEAKRIGDLWSACLQSLGLEHYIFHPEELLDLSAEQAESIIGAYGESNDMGEKQQFRVRRQMRLEAEVLLSGMLKKVGRETTLRALLKALTGEDLMDTIRPLLIRQLGNYLDLGTAAWHNVDRDKGFYASWRGSAERDLAWVFEDMPEWRDELDALPEEVMDVVVTELKHLGLPEERWVGYLERLALELPGWSGMFLWRHIHPDYKGLKARFEMLDYLAVRLILERMFAQRLCRNTWRIAPDLDILRWYFRSNKDEFLVRYALFNLRLPEYAVNRAHQLVKRVGERAPGPEEWRYAAHVIWTWRHSPAADRPKGHSVYRSGWRLFRLAQHLGLDADILRALSGEQVGELLACLDRLTPDRTGFLWLQAFENHYRDELFHAVFLNHGRGRWKTREQRPQAQVVFCMDDREEGVRRHLEEHNPAIETLGAAGFFGVAINWKALDDRTTTALCPVVVRPAHEVRETPEPKDPGLLALHDQRRGLRLSLGDFLLNDTRHRLITGIGGMVLAAPLALAALTAKIFSPLRAEKSMHHLKDAVEPAVPTGLELSAEDDGGEATPDNNRLGFTDAEQADRVQGFLRAIGLTEGFAPLVVMMGHGSVSENNPHESAHDCGACSGRHGGPNARVFAAMANRPEVRLMLEQRGLRIPDDTWFMGAMHNTCDESYHWYDLSRMPSAYARQFQDLSADLEVAARGSAHERCRKFDAAPANPSFKRAYDHIRGRAYDISQVRPEFGHCTNTAAFIGRRSLSQGAFFDRRVFLISYDPSADPEGTVIESILLNAGPVGAGINLEYYFSTVDNDRYGCSSKITHNVAGFFGIMDGAESDLRTGLPMQMIEIHEAMRLQVLVEAKTEVLTAIYLRQPPLQELVGKGWLLLSAKDPDSDSIQLFQPDRGWVPWEGGERSPLATVDHSMDWYRGSRVHLPPALVRQPEEARHAQ